MTTEEIGWTEERVFLAREARRAEMLASTGRQLKHMSEQKRQAAFGDLSMDERSELERRMNESDADDAAEAAHQVQTSQMIDVSANGRTLLSEWQYHPIDCRFVRQGWHSTAQRSAEQKLWVRKAHMHN